VLTLVAIVGYCCVVHHKKTDFSGNNALALRG
jgi:hypothetical protein